jgi:tetratricopeptide (TPR) repeat protein
MAVHRAIVAEADQIAQVDPRKAALLLIHATGPCYMAAEILEGKRTAQRALDMARTAADQITIAAAEVTLAEVLLLHGEDAQTAAMLRQYLPQLAAADPDIVNSVATIYGPYSQICAEDFGPALNTLQAEITRHRSAGALSLLPYPLAVLSELDFRTGRWLSGYANAAESVRLALETGADNTRTYSLICLARFEATTGRDDECRTHLDEAWELAERFETGSIFTYVLTIRGLLALGREQWAVARESLEQVQHMCQRQEMREPGLLRFHADLVEACVRIGDQRRAEQVLAELEEQAKVTGRRWARIAALRSRGMLAEGSAVESYLKEAVALAREARDPFELARTELSFGEGLRRMRRRGDARQHFRSALEIFLELGAAHGSDGRSRSSPPRANGSSAKPRRREPRSHRKSCRSAWRWPAASRTRKSPPTSSSVRRRSRPTSATRTASSVSDRDLSWRACSRSNRNRRSQPADYPVRST